MALSLCNSLHGGRAQSQILARGSPTLAVDLSLRNRLNVGRWEERDSCARVADLSSGPTVSKRTSVNGGKEEERDSCVRVADLSSGLAM